MESKDCFSDINVEKTTLEDVMTSRSNDHVAARVAILVIECLGMRLTFTRLRA